MYRFRTQEITPSSIANTITATVKARWKFGIRNGSVCPIPPAVVITPVIAPRSTGRPRPVSDPSSDTASAKAIEIPAPMDAARPTRKASQLFLVAKAAANTGANVDTDPSINPANPGCTICNMNNRRCASSSDFSISGDLGPEFLGRNLMATLDLFEIAEQFADPRI